MSKSVCHVAFHEEEASYNCILFGLQQYISESVRMFDETAGKVMKQGTYSLSHDRRSVLM